MMDAMQKARAETKADDADEWVAIVPGRKDGDPLVRWFVLYCESDGGESIVADCATEDEAMTDASFWHLPIVPWRAPSVH